MSRNAVLLSFVKLKLQPLNVQSINLNSERSLSVKLQLLKMQFSYSPFVSVSFRSKVLSCMYVSCICLFCHLERCLVTLATNVLALGAGGDFSSINLLIRSKLGLPHHLFFRSTAPPLELNACYGLVVFFHTWVWCLVLHSVFHRHTFGSSVLLFSLLTFRGVFSLSDFLLNHQILALAADARLRVFVTCICTPEILLFIFPRPVFFNSKQHASRSFFQRVIVFNTTTYAIRPTCP